jgi:hypothetical protein
MPSSRPTQALGSDDDAAVSGERGDRACELTIAHAHEADRDDEYGDHVEGTGLSCAGDTGGRLLSPVPERARRDLGMLRVDPRRDDDRMKAKPFTRLSQHGVMIEIPPVAQTPDGQVVRNLMMMWSRVVSK